MNLFQRIGAAIVGQVDRENAATSGTASAEAASVNTAGGWKAIADDLAFTLGRLVEALEAEHSESFPVKIERLHSKARLQVYNAAARREVGR